MVFLILKIENLTVTNFAFLWAVFSKKLSRPNKMFCVNGEILKNDKQDVQTVRLDELNNIVIRANISFIFKN